MMNSIPLIDKEKKLDSFFSLSQNINLRKIIRIILTKGALR